MLLGAPNQLLLLVALGGLIGPVGSIESVESNGVSTGLYYSNTTGLRGESMLLWAPNSNTLGGLWILDSQRLDCRPWRIDPNGSLV